jgi:hypothetical protein
LLLLVATHCCCCCWSLLPPAVAESCGWPRHGQIDTGGTDLSESLPATTGAPREVPLDAIPRSEVVHGVLGIGLCLLRGGPCAAGRGLKASARAG